MDKEEFLKRRRELVADFEQLKNKLSIEYVMSKNPVKIGDIVKDHCVTIQVEEMKAASIYADDPTCRYYGSLVNKDGTLNKLGKKEFVYLSNVRSINRVEYQRNGVIVAKP